LDIGAHKGEISSILLKAGMKVAALEPLPECLDSLNGIQIKYGKSITIYSQGVSNSEGKRPFFKANLSEVSKFSNEFMEAYGRYDYLKWQEVGFIYCTTIMRLIEQHQPPYFIKMDIEGHEMEAFESLNIPIPLVQFEWNQLTINVAFSVIEHLNKLGNYSYNWLPGEKYRLMKPVHLSSQNLINTLNKEKDLHLTGEILAILDN
jgi:FkbM family methyltransferase